MMYFDLYIAQSILSHYLNEESEFQNQVALFNQIFCAYLEKCKPDGVDPSEISRLMRSLHGMSKEAVRYYHENSELMEMAKDIEFILNDVKKYNCVARRFYECICLDAEAEMELRDEIMLKAEYATRKEASVFIAYAIRFAISRRHYKRNKDTMEVMLPEWFSPVLEDYRFGSSPPRPNRYFCGREKELELLHNMLIEDGTVFVHGLAAIGKSELVYKYCDDHKNDFRNVLYLDYSGDLRRDVTNLGVWDPRYNMDEQYKQKIHYLKLMRRDTLLIIDNYNPSSCEVEFQDLMECECRKIVVTRHFHNQKNCLELKEIQDMSALITLMEHYYGEPLLDVNAVEKLIDAVNRHTMAVILMAMILKKGSHSPKVLINKLKKREIYTFLRGKIPFRRHKYNESRTYYDHIRMLFHLTALGELEKYTMRNMVLIPRSGITISKIKDWIGVQYLDTVEELVASGLIHDDRGILSLKPLIREIAEQELRPSIDSCRTLICAVTERMNKEIDCTDNKYLKLMPPEVIGWARVDDMDTYLRFLHSAYHFLERYEKYDVMQMIISEFQLQLQTPNHGTQLDRAFLAGYMATQEQDLQKSIETYKFAMGLLDDSWGNQRVAANYFNEMARKCMELNLWDEAGKYSDQCWDILDKLMLTNSDAYNEFCTRGIILCATGREVQGLEMLEKAKKRLEFARMTESWDYVAVLDAMRRSFHLLGNREEENKYSQWTARVERDVKKREQ